MNSELFKSDKALITLIKLALEEDLSTNHRDITTELLFSKLGSLKKTAHFYSKETQSLVMCGLPLVRRLLEVAGPDCYFIGSYAEEGALVGPGEHLLSLTGPITQLLKLERILLNFLQRLCAIATQTAQFVAHTQHTLTRILDTRKTLPGFRALDKYAVQCGGGGNHRMGLYDAIMLKDTHIDALGMEKALAILPLTIHNHYPVIVEVRNEMELDIVLSKGISKVSRILFDNLSIEILHRCVTRCLNRVSTEASGSVKLENVSEIAETGVDFISIGQLTHSVIAADLSMQIEINC